MSVSQLNTSFARSLERTKVECCCYLRRCLLSVSDEKRGGKTPQLPSCLQETERRHPLWKQQQQSSTCVLSVLEQQITFQSRKSPLGLDLYSKRLSVFMFNIFRTQANVSSLWFNFSLNNSELIVLLLVFGQTCR